MAAISGGRRVADPELAQAVVAQARRQQRATAPFIACSAIGVVIRVVSLASDEGDGWALLDVMVIALWLVAASAMGLSVIRARRTIAANRPDG